MDSLTLLAHTEGDPRVHVTFAGRATCLCGAPITSTEAGTFASRDPGSCPLCALALVVQPPKREESA